MEMTLNPGMVKELNECRPSSVIRYCNIDKRVVVLQLVTGKYFQFDHSASLIWSCFIQKADINNCIQQLRAEFGISSSLAGKDVVKFIRDCKRQGFLVSSNESVSKQLKRVSPLQAPSYFTAVSCIFKTRHLLKRHGFSQTYSKHLAFDWESSRAAKSIDVTRTIRTFERAENFFSSANARIDCLPRSLSLHRFLFSVGIPSTHIVGVKKFPFLAHAWVEVESKPVFETTEYTSQFTPLSRIAHG